MHCNSRPHLVAIKSALNHVRHFSKHVCLAGLAPKHLVKGKAGVLDALCLPFQPDAEAIRQAHHC